MEAVGRNRLVNMSSSESEKEQVNVGYIDTDAFFVCNLRSATYAYCMNMKDASYAFPIPNNKINNNKRRW